MLLYIQFLAIRKFSTTLFYDRDRIDKITIEISSEFAYTLRVIVINNKPIFFLITIYTLQPIFIYLSIDLAFFSTLYKFSSITLLLLIK